jgi:hypothetical protein
MPAMPGGLTTCRDNQMPEEIRQFELACLVVSTVCVKSSPLCPPSFFEYSCYSCYSWEISFFLRR